jgi:urease accessory protein
MDAVALLRLQQVFDSQFPVGAFAHSGGLETYSHVAGFDPGELRDLLLAQIRLGWGRLDLAAAALAFRTRDDAELSRLGAELQAWKPIPGQRLAGERIGRRMLILAKRLYPDLTGRLDIQPPQAPVVAGALARRLGLEERMFLLFYAQSSLTAALAAATRSMPLSPERAHQTLVELQPRLAEQVELVSADPAAAMFAATPALDLRAHQQAFLHTRLFQS